VRSSGKGRRLRALAVFAAGVALLLGAQVIPSATASVAHQPGPKPLTMTAGVIRPHKFGELDCNDLSPIQRSVKPSMMCEDPHGSWGGRFYEHGHYIGHDEPSVRFLSDVPGSGSDFSMNETLPVDPAAKPTVKTPGSDVTHWFELTPAPWISITVCDPDSAPLTPCTPESDANAPQGNYPGGGAAFVELQFYPPGFAPFADSTSCDNAHWCSALTIDSLECTGNGSGPCNPDCTEPVNFAFIQRNGVPTGPPSPQLSDLKSDTPNRHTLLMNPGDKITVQMFDATVPGGHALEAKEIDHTTGQTGYMIASSANGFMNTNPFSCKGAPFNFEPEYNTARPQNIVPWGVGPYEINSEFEIGHFEACTSVRGKATISIGKFTDTYYKHCAGPYEAAKDSGDAFEPNDSPCYKAGDTHHGTAAPNLMTGCDVFFGAIGDLDYDGSPYWPDWPDSTTPNTFPSTFQQQQPTTTGGVPYRGVQFMTDSSATQFNTNCNLETGSGCVLPPKGPGNFYPFWTQAQVNGDCVWEFGNMKNGNDFGGDAQYGSVGPDTIGAFVGLIIRNPACRSAS
jgi:hypothetical protein